MVKLKTEVLPVGESMSRGIRKGTPEVFYRVLLLTSDSILRQSKLPDTVLALRLFRKPCQELGTPAWFPRKVKYSTATYPGLQPAILDCSVVRLL